MSLPAPITYEDIIDRAMELQIVERHQVKKTKGSNYYLRIFMGIYTWDPRVDELRRWVEERATKPPTFSHNPVKGTITFTLYED